MLLAARQSSAPGARGGAGSGSSMPQVALVLEVTLFPPLAGVAAAAGAGRTGVAGHPPPQRAPGTPPPGRGRHVPLVFVLLGDLVADGGEVCGQVSVYLGIVPMVL